MGKIFARVLRFAFVVCAVVATASTFAQEERKTVQSGGSVVVVSKAAKVENRSGPLKGAVSVVESTTDPKTFSLVYVAPKVTAELTDAVKYSDGTDHTVLVAVTPANDPPSLSNDKLYGQSFKALFALFVLAAILESGLAILFNWRPFIYFFDGRGIKTIISVLFAYFFVEAFQMDIVTKLVNVYSEASFPTNFPGKLITALVIAGGSSAVNNLMIALGLRSVKTEVEATAKPQPNEAWIAASLKRVAAKGPVQVLVGPDKGTAAVAGMITGYAKKGSVLRFLLRDYGRFPTAGGYSVTPGTAYTVQLKGEDHSGNPLESKVWGPAVLAAGAIVDIELTL